MRSKIAANQASAVGSLRTLNTSCIAFSTSYGQFPAALTNLGPVNGGTASSTSADLIDAVLSAGTKSGYTFVYTAGNNNQSYTITATPITAATTGQNMYFTDQSGDPRGYIRFGRRRHEHPDWISFSEGAKARRREVPTSLLLPFVESVFIDKPGRYGAAEADYAPAIALKSTRLVFLEFSQYA